MLKYKYIFQIKYTEAILSNNTQKLSSFEITKTLIALLIANWRPCAVLNSTLWKYGTDERTDTCRQLHRLSFSELTLIQSKMASFY